MSLITDEDREALRQAMKDFDISAAMRIAFGKCPECREPLVHGWWLEWCPDRTCNGYVGPKRHRDPLPPGFDLPKAHADLHEFDLSSVRTELEQADA